MQGNYAKRIGISGIGTIIAEKWVDICSYVTYSVEHAILSARFESKVSELNVGQTYINK
jgi:hypothetical protein